MDPIVEMEGILQSVSLNASITTNQGDRNHMEDAYSAFIPSPKGTDAYAFFAVYDGHGGELASSFVKEHLEKEITKLPGFLSDDDDAVLESIKTGFLSCNELLKAELIKLGKLSQEGRFTEGTHSKVGTTATVVFVRNEKMFIGHAGDSRMVLGYKDPASSDDLWKAKQLTKDHKPEDPEELARITSAGGRIFTNPRCGISRVVWSFPTGHCDSDGPLKKRQKFDGQPFESPMLSIARSLGDFWSYNEVTKEYVVSPVPDVSVLQVDINEQKCLILGTDGLWDVVTPEEAVEEMRLAKIYNLQQDKKEKDLKYKLPRSIPASEILQAAFKKQLHLYEGADNITVIAIYLEPMKDRQETP